MAGVDKSGNTYFRELQKIDGAETERRWVEFRKSSSNLEPIPVEWNSWLNGRRKDAPTQEEMMELEARRNAIKVKAALLQKEDEKQRYRAKALQQGMNQDDVSPHTMTKFLQQVTEGNAPVQGEAGSTKQQRGDGQPESTFKPGTWNPIPDGTKSAEPMGTGDKFKPGTWKP